MTRIVASLLMFCAAGLPIQQTANVQEKTTTADSVEASVTYFSGDIKAGEDFNFTVTLDRATNFHGGALAISFGRVNGDGSVTASTALEPGQTTYHLHVGIPEAAKGGIWKLTNLEFWNSSAWVNLPHREVSFRVIPTPGIVYPASAEVTVNLNQKQLLRREATRLQERIQQLKSAVSEYVRANQEGAVSPLLQENLKASMAALKSTQVEFSNLTTSEAQKPDAKVFFEDLRATYDEALSHLARVTANRNRKPQLVRVSRSKTISTEALLSLTLRPMEQNELAYAIVADQNSLTFDLDVDSTPAGATVSYNRRGDSPRMNPDPTRSTIHSLPYAIWTIHFQKAGYKSDEREHDPFREQNHAIHVDLHK